MLSHEFWQVNILKVQTALKEMTWEILFKLVKANFKKSQSHLINNA